MSVSAILQQMAENAGRAQLARGQTYGSLIENAANIPAQIMADRETQAARDLARQRETAQMLYAQRADARAQTDQARQDAQYAAELKDRADWKQISSVMYKPDGTYDYPAAVQKAHDIGRPDLSDEVQKHAAANLAFTNPKPYETDPTKDLRDPRTHALIRPGQPKMPEIGTDAYERAMAIRALTDPGVDVATGVPFAPGAPAPGPAPSLAAPPAAVTPYVRPGSAPTPADLAPPPSAPGGPGAPATTAAPPPTADPRATDPSWRRADGTMKGNGFLGVLTRPDGNVSSEISIGVNIDGKEVEIPTLVPTLTSVEKNWLLTHDISDPKKIPMPIQQKAIDFARPRIAAGLSPFAGPDESPATPGAPGAPAAQPRRPLTMAEATAKVFADHRAAIEAAKGEHSPIYKEWQDYTKQGGKLDFDAYMTMDANRKKPVVNVGSLPIPDLPAWATNDARPTGPEANQLDRNISMTPNGLHQAALNYIATGQFPPTGRGEGPTARAQRAAITSKVGAIAAASGMDEPVLRAFYKANAASLGQQQKMFDTAQANITTADRNVAELEKVLTKLPDTGSPYFNKPLRAFEKTVSGDPNMAPIATYLASVQNEYGKIINSATGGSSVLTDSARHEAQTLLDPNATVAQMLGSIQALKTEGGNRLLSIGDQIKQIQDRMQGGPPKTGKPIQVGGFSVVVK